jgi:hypothetical protein
MVTIKGKVVSIVSKVKKNDAAQEIGNSYNVYLVGTFSEAPACVKFIKKPDFKEGQQVMVDCTQSQFNNVIYNKAVE